MSCQNMSRRRAMSASNDNRISSSRQPQFESNLGWTPNGKSAYAHSPAKVFIKPKAEASFDDRGRRISLIPLPAHQQRNTRPSLPTSTKSAYALRGRTSSLHNSAVNFSSNAPPVRLRRSSTIVQPMRAKPVFTSSVDNSVRVGGFGQAVSVNTVVKTQDKVQKGFSTGNKENAPQESSRTSVSSERSPRKNCGFVRKQSPLVPDEHRLSQRSPTKTFLLPKVEERTPKPQAVLTRRSSTRSVAPKLEKRRSQAKKKLDEASIPSLPTIVMEHTPMSSPTRPSEGAVSQEEGKGPVMCSSPAASYCQTNMTPVMKPSSRLFLLPRQPGTVPSSSSINSLLSLPTQILKHTPLASQLYRTPHDASPSRSPCLSKARTKTVWTMLDEMNLVRSGGLLSHAHALAPNSQVRMVPLCKRLRNGADASDSVHGTTLVKTPVRSSSTPHHLLGSMEQRTYTEPSSDLPPLPSLSHALARAHAEWECPTEGVPKKTNDSEKYDWTVVDIKKPRLRSSSRTPIPGAYGLYVREPAKPSLLTRAQTFVKFKFSASKKVVGRGDPKWA